MQVATFNTLTKSSQTHHLNLKGTKCRGNSGIEFLKDWKWDGFNL